MKLLFIRHAESIGNQQQRMEGQSSTPLSEQGEIQVQKLAQKLQAEDWFPNFLYSSPLQRAAQTTEILMNSLCGTSRETSSIKPIQPPVVDYRDELQVDYRDELQEFQNGIFQGLTWLEARTQYPDLCGALETSLDWIPIPGAESLQAGRDRAQSFIQFLLNTHNQGDQIGVVTHSWILQQLVAVLMGCDRIWKFQANHTALFEFWIDRDRWELRDPHRLNSELWEIRRFNDYQHLL